MIVSYFSKNFLKNCYTFDFYDIYFILIICTLELQNKCHSQLLIILIHHINLITYKAIMFMQLIFLFNTFSHYFL